MFRVFDQMSWPAPCKEMSELAWNLKFSPQDADLVLASSIVYAYMEMVRATAKKRNSVVKELRLGPNVGAYRHEEKPE